MDDLVEHLGHLAGKSPLIGEQLVKDGADGEHVAAMIDAVGRAGNLLRRHVVDRANEHAVMRQAGAGQLDNPEVEHLQAAVGVDDQVGRLDIAMDDVGAMGVREAGAESLDELELSRDRERLPPANDGRERLARDVLHRDERPLLKETELVDGDNVGV